MSLSTSYPTTDSSNEDLRASQMLEEFSAIFHNRVASQSLCKHVAHVKTVCTMARACPYSRKITHYASIMPDAAKYVLFPLLCRHNLSKPSRLSPSAGRRSPPGTTVVPDVGDAVRTHRSGGQSEHEPIRAACNRLAQLSTCTYLLQRRCESDAAAPRHSLREALYCVCVSLVIKTA